MSSNGEFPAHATGVESLSAQLIRGYASRCAMRADAPGEECATDQEWSLQADGVFCRATADGTLAKVRQGSAWVLYLEWSGGYGRRLLARGSREYVERYALDVTVHGPPGGPEFHGQGTDWRRVGGDDTLHAVTLGGEFRLMPLVGGLHLLLFARNDFGVCVLGLGEAAELQRTADERLQHFRGAALQLRVGNERISLRGVGAAGVVGYIESFDGARVLLGHLEGERFGLFVVRGETGECLGLFDLAALHRGGLLQAFGGLRPDIACGEGEEEAAPVVRREAESGTQAYVAREPRQPPAPQVGRRQLSPAELQLIHRHLTPDVPVMGPGASVVPKLLEGLRVLAQRGLTNQLLRGCDLRTLIETQAEIEFNCGAKTFGRALTAVAARTQLLRRAGKRWLIRFGDLLLVDSELMRWIANVTAEAETLAAPATSIPVESSTGRGAPLLDLAEVGEDSAADPTADAGDSESSSTASSTAVDVDDGRVAPQCELSESARYSLAREQEWNTRESFSERFRREGPLQVTMASVPTEESASRRPLRKKERGPP